jgi:hypothetical protein
MELTLTEHECELIKDVVSPDEIDVDFSSIGSLEDIKSTAAPTLFFSSFMSFAAGPHNAPRV